MKINIYIKTLLVFIIFTVSLIGLFYFLPKATEKQYPPPKNAEWIRLQKSLREKGYLTEDEVELMNKLGDQEILRRKGNKKS